MTGMIDRFGVGRFFAAAVVALLACAARANNLRVSNLGIKGRDSKTAYVEFDISWENSWRYGEEEGDDLCFHDAAWIFFKVWPEGRGSESMWDHVYLEGSGENPPGFSIGTGTPIELVVPEDGTGMFVRRSQEGEGTTSVQRVTAVWNFTSGRCQKHCVKKCF